MIISISIIIIIIIIIDIARTTIIIRSHREPAPEDVLGLTPNGCYGARAQRENLGRGYCLDMPQLVSEGTVWTCQ